MRSSQITMVKKKLDLILLALRKWFLNMWLIEIIVRKHFLCAKYNYETWVTKINSGTKYFCIKLHFSGSMEGQSLEVANNGVRVIFFENKWEEGDVLIV